MILARFWAHRSRPAYPNYRTFSGETPILHCGRPKQQIGGKGQSNSPKCPSLRGRTRRRVRPNLLDTRNPFRQPVNRWNDLIGSFGCDYERIEFQRGRTSGSYFLELNNVHDTTLSRANHFYRQRQQALDPQYGVSS
jgi:hypothetical protein